MNEFKKGDRVRIVKKAHREFMLHWVPSMDSTIGTLGVIEKKSPRVDIESYLVRFDDSAYWSYLPESLERAETKNRFDVVAVDDPIADIKTPEFEAYRAKALEHFASLPLPKDPPTHFNFHCEIPFFQTDRALTYPTKPPQNLVIEYEDGLKKFRDEHKPGDWFEIIMVAKPGDGGWMGSDINTVGKELIGFRGQCDGYYGLDVAVKNYPILHMVPFYCLKPVDGPHPPRGEYTNSFPAMREFLHDEKS